MTDKQLKKLKRAELIELVYYLKKENERLEALIGGKERTLSQADIDAVAKGVADILSGKAEAEPEAEQEAETSEEQEAPAEEDTPAEEAASNDSEGSEQ